MDCGWIERPRGIDNWPFVQASVTAVLQASGGRRGGAWRRVFFTCRCGSEDYAGKLSVDSNSSVYELLVGDTFDIQYTLRKPSRHFCQEALTLYSTVRRTMLIHANYQYDCARIERSRQERNIALVQEQPRP